MRKKWADQVRRTGDNWKPIIYVTRKPGICSILGSRSLLVPRLSGVSGTRLRIARYSFQVWRTILGLSMLELNNDDSSVHVDLEEEKILKEEKTDAAHPWGLP